MLTFRAHYVINSGLVNLNMRSTPNRILGLSALALTLAVGSDTRNPEKAHEPEAVAIAENTEAVNANVKSVVDAPAGAQVDAPAGAPVAAPTKILTLEQRYKNLEANNIAQGRKKRFIAYNEQTNEWQAYVNHFAFIDPEKEPYAKRAAEISAEQESPDGKLRAIGVWIQRNLKYLYTAGATPERIAIESLEKNSGDCRDSTIIFKTMAESIGLSQEVGAAIFPGTKKKRGHIAPIMKGAFGPTTYTMDGETWTLFEVSTKDGEVLPIGYGTEETPQIFLRPNGSITVPTGSPLKIVHYGETSKIPANLVANLEKSLKEIEDFINSPGNVISPNTLQIGAMVEYMAVEKAEATHKAMIAIMKAGAVSEELLAKYQKTGERLMKLLERWQEFDKNDQRK